MNATNFSDRLSKSLSEAVLNATDNGILIVDTNRKVLQYNSRFVELFKIPPALQKSDEDKELLDFVLHQIIDPQQFIDKIRELYSQPEVESLDMIMFQDGRIFERFSRPMYLNDEVVARVWSFRDITVTENIKREFAKEIGFRKNIIQTLPDLVWLKDAEGVYLGCNKRFEQLFGASEAEIIGKTDYDFVDSELADSFKLYDKKAMYKDAPSVNEEWVTFANDGHREFLETTKIPMYNDAQELIGVLGIAHDITKSDKKLYESSQILQGIIETTLDGFWAINYQGNLLEVNSTYCQQSGYTREELLTMHISQLDATESLLEIKKRIQIIMKQKHLQFEVKHRRKDGSIWDVEVSITNLDISDGRMFAFLRDITERKKMEEALKQSEEILIINSRHAAMGEMISMIAHQWRQPLNVMGLAIANLQTKQALDLLSPTEIENRFDIILKNITYMSDTIDDFRDFFKPEQSPNQITIENVINGTLDIIGKTIEDEKITLRVQNNSHRSLQLYKNKLIQVILNLLNNAIYALISKKVKNPAISITVHETEVSATITVCDNAGGVSNEILSQLGEPYFTTKGLNGTGLGLYMSKTILEKYFNGTLTWHNQNQGVCFIIIINS